MRAVPAVLALVAITGCGGDDGDGAATVAFDLAGPLEAETYWDLPFPSDLRLTAAGTPDVAGYPNKRAIALITDPLRVAANRRGFPVMPVVYFRFTAPPAAHALADVYRTDQLQDAMLLDIDPASPEHGTRFAVVAKTLIADDFSPASLVAIAPRPGIVLRPGTRYAVILRTGFAPGFVQPAAFAELASGRTPDGARGAAAAALYAPLWGELATLGVPVDDVLVATVFTTGDEVGVLRARSEAVRAMHDAVIADLHVDPVDGADHDGFCELIGTVTYPQFQRGTPPFDTDGDFALDADGAPIAQGEMTVPLAITLPSGEMPATGWPLYQFFHGSGGLSSGVVDLGRTPSPDAEPEVGKGPGWVVARHGIAAASSALPVNPERQPGASDIEYINFRNLAAFPYTFQQGVIEQRLLLDALLELQIPPSVVSACAGVDLPTGQTRHHFDPAKLVAGGQSMGGMYTNLIGAVEERYGALVPTGAGGMWHLMILETALLPAVREVIAAQYATDGTELTFVHPGLNALALGWEIAEPLTAMARITRRPLPGFVSRNVYEPVGFEDIYFGTDVYDAAALAYGNQLAGEVVWPTMLDALGIDDAVPTVSYPVANNRSYQGTNFTGVVIQHPGDGIVDSHYLYRQIESVKHQYGCFLATYLATGVATVPAPGLLTDPCE
jgi:hypothetical protein